LLSQKNKNQYLKQEWAEIDIVGRKLAIPFTQDKDIRNHQVVDLFTLILTGLQSVNNVIFIYTIHSHPCFLLYISISATEWEGLHMKNIHNSSIHHFVGGTKVSS